VKNPFGVRIGEFDVCKEELYKGLGGVADCSVRSRYVIGNLPFREFRCESFLRGGNADRAKPHHASELGYEPGYELGEEILDNSSVRCRLAAHSVGSQMICAHRTTVHRKASPCHTSSSCHEGENGFGTMSAFEKGQRSGEVRLCPSGGSWRSCVYGSGLSGCMWRVRTHWNVREASPFAVWLATKDL